MSDWTQLGVETLWRKVNLPSGELVEFVGVHISGQQDEPTDGFVADSEASHKLPAAEKLVDVIESFSHRGFDMPSQILDACKAYREAGIEDDE